MKSLSSIKMKEVLSRVCPMQVAHVIITFILLHCNWTKFLLSLPSIAKNVSSVLVYN